MNSCEKCGVDLSEYFNNQIFSDVRLYTKSRTFFTSSLVLSIHSPVLKKLIVEENEKDIFLDSFLDEEEEMEMIISSFYNRSNLQVTAETLFTVAKFGVTYKVPWIWQAAIEYVKSNISRDNCISLSRAGYRLKENFNFPPVSDICCAFLRSTKFLEEIVVDLENIEEDELFLSLPASFFKNLLQNSFRRDESRMVNLVKRWLGRDSNVIQAMEILPLLQLSQLFLVNNTLHSEFFEFLATSDKLTTEDKKTILELSARSIENSKNCMITALGFSKEVPKEMKGSQSIREFLLSPTWLKCSFDDILMVRQFRGANQFIHIEIFLVWMETNPITESQVKAVLNSVDLSRVTKEYVDDLIAHLKKFAYPVLPDNFHTPFDAKIAAHNFEEQTIREYAAQNLNVDNVKSLKMKKHTLSKRPCKLSRCYERTLGSVEIKIKRDCFPFYKTGRQNIGPTMLEHSHNSQVHHVYFVVESRIVSCYGHPWERLEEMLRPDCKGCVTIRVVCQGG